MKIASGRKCQGDKCCENVNHKVNKSRNLRTSVSCFSWKWKGVKDPETGEKRALDLMNEQHLLPPQNQRQGLSPGTSEQG